MIRNLKIALRVLTIILFCLIFFAINTTFLTRAKSIKMSNSNEKSGSTAKYVFLSSPSDSKDLTIDCRTDETKGIWTATYPFSVSNTKDGKTSEVTISYEIVVTLPSALVNGVSMSLTCNGLSITPKSTTSTKYTYNGYTHLSASVSTTHSYSLMFTVDATVIVNMVELNGISIDINSSQVD